MKIHVTSAGIKHLAMLFMLIDHIGAVLLPDGPVKVVFRIVGRLSFPLFAYLTAIGTEKSTNRKAYAMRILIFALISQIPYSLAFHNTLLSFEDTNVLFTLFLGVGCIISMEMISQPALKVFPIIISCAVAYFIKSDYDIVGVAVITALYLFRDKISNVIIIDGKGKQLPKYFYYAFYPAHLLVLWGIAQVIK